MEATRPFERCAPKFNALQFIALHLNLNFHEILIISLGDILCTKNGNFHRYSHKRKKNATCSVIYKQ